MTSLFILLLLFCQLLVVTRRRAVGPTVHAAARGGVDGGVDHCFGAEASANSTGLFVYCFFYVNVEF